MNLRRSNRRTHALEPCNWGHCKKSHITSSVNQFSSKHFLFSSGALPPTDDYPGYYDFAVLLGQIASTKNKWTYSEKLSKLYIVWCQVIPLEFRSKRGESNLVVRALPLYTDPQYFREPVLRCMIHLDPNDITNEGCSQNKHIIRSENPGVIYEENHSSGRCSVVVPLGELQPGTGTVTVTYKFMCKTSCVTGMMRRPMVVVFTLERPTGEVLGRQTMGVKVCSCPRRDMEKEETMLRRTLRTKLTTQNESRYQLDVFIPDIELHKKVLEFNHGGVSSLLRTTPVTDPRYNELMDFLTLLEEKIRNTWSRFRLEHPQKTIPYVMRE